MAGAKSETDLPDPEDVASVATDFTTDVELTEEELADDKFYFGFVCPRCEETNKLVGDPSKFGKPFRCLNCDYVPLLDSDALEEFAEEVDY